MTRPKTTGGGFARPKVTLALATVAAALAVTACGGADAGTDGAAPGVDAEAKKVTVGGWNIASGPFAGQAAAGYGAEACIDASNAAGGVNGWKFDLNLDDTAGDPTRALQETKKQVEGAETFAMIWAPGTSSNASVMPYIDGKEMPYQPGMSGDPLLGKKLTNVFPMIPPYSRLGYQLANFAMGELKGKRIALLYENSGIGQDMAKTIGEHIEAKDGKLVAKVSTAPDDSDFTPMSITLAKAKPDVVIAQTGPTALVKTKAALMAAGQDVPWVSGYHVASDAVVDLDPATMDGTYFNSYLVPFFSDHAAAVKFRKDMKKHKPDTKADIQSINGYASCQIFLEAFKLMTADGASPTQAGLIDAFEQIGKKPIGVNGEITYTPQEHLGNSAAYVIRWQRKGGWSVVEDAKPLPTEPGGGDNG